jgi:hypothetical protein
MWPTRRDVQIEQTTDEGPTGGVRPYLGTTDLVQTSKESKIHGFQELKV